MSYFIANSIRFSKDFQTYQLKGGDNNVIPRSNSWTNDIPIKYLYGDVSGGMVQFKNKTNEKIQFIQNLVNEFDYGGDWENETDYYHEFRKENHSQKMIDFNEKFINALIDGLKNLSNKKEFIIEINGRYITKRMKRGVYTTNFENQAQKFSKYVALSIAKDYDFGNKIKVIKQSNKIKIYG